MSAKIPRLLVSVRSLEEAKIALAAGAQIIDIKEPMHGSLGRADLAVIQCITRELNRLRPGLPVSAAWGELSQSIPPVASGPLPSLDYVKIGMAGVVDSSEWMREWVDLRTKISQSVHPGCKTPDWIAVAYADADLAKSPPLDEILSAAVETGCAGMLVDTWSKASGRLLELLSVDRLQSLVEELHSHNLMCIAAGKVRISDVPLLSPLGVDVIAVRSAACEQGDRMGRLSPAAIAKLRQEIERGAVAGSSSCSVVSG